MIEQLNPDEKERLCRKLADNLPALRAKASLTQDDLAECLGFSRQTVNALENGKRVMQWSTFTSIVLFFLQGDEIRALMEAMDIYTKGVQVCLQPNHNLFRRPTMENLEQRGFNDSPKIINASESHMALVFLLDTSGSMSGNPIRDLNAGLNRFKEEVCKDKQTRDILDIAIVEFNSTHRVVQEFVPVEYMNEVKLDASGGTVMAPAIETALNMVNDRSKFYRTSGTVPYKPWVILVSDGAPGDDISYAIKRIKDMEEYGKVSFRSLGVEGYDSKVLHSLSGPKVMKLTGTDFTSFFDWVTKSMRSVSQSSPHEKPEAVNLSGNVVVDTNWD